MATTERDYYELLGVPRTATEAEIKKAFRALARELHPDVSDDPDAEERFKEVVEAYEVLSNSERRELYDRYGHAGLRSRGFAPTELRLRHARRSLLRVLRRRPLRRRRRGRAALRGARTSPPRSRSSSSRPRGASTRDVPFHVAVAVRDLRRHRRRAGHVPGDLPDLRRQRPAPAGLEHRLRPVRAHPGLRPLRRHRPGRRAPVQDVRAAPAASLEERTLEVEIPPGIHDGQRIRIGGEGHAGELGGQAGDLYVLVHVRPDPRFVREGNDICLDRRPDDDAGRARRDA